MSHCFEFRVIKTTLATFGIIVFFNIATYLVQYNYQANTDCLYSGQCIEGRLSIPQTDSGPILRDPHLKTEIISSGLKFPTSMAFLSNNDILVLEKNEGDVRRIVNGVMLPEPLLKVNVSSIGERGMLGIAILKRDNESKLPYVFLYFTEVTSKQNTFNGNEDNSPTVIRNRLVRYELTDDRLVNGKLIFELDPKGRIVHNGGKIIVGPDNNVYLVIGDNMGRVDPQMEEFQNGRAGILRFTPEGDSVKNESGKSILSNVHPLDKYYAYGIRNSFGINFDPLTGKLWDTENGPEYGDEINLVEQRFNSGWGKIQGFWTDPHSNNTTLIPPPGLLHLDGKLKYSHPELATRFPAGLTALAFIESTNYGKQYENDMLVGDFHNGFLYHFDLTGSRTELNLNGTLEDRIVDEKEELMNNLFGYGFGAITDIKVGPDGNIYVLALHQGGDNCNGNTAGKCVEYNSSLAGNIIKIFPSDSLVEKEQE